MKNKDFSKLEIDAMDEFDLFSLPNAREILQTIFNNFSAVFYLLQSTGNGDSRFIYMGKNIEKLTGFPAEEFVLKSDFWLKHLHPEDRAVLSKDGRRHLPLKDQKLVYRFQTATGEYCWLRDELYLLKQNGVEPYFVGLLIDITEEKSLKTIADKESVRLQAIIESSGQIIWETDASGKVVEDLPFWRAFTGQAYEQIKGTGWIKAVHPEDRARVQQAWNEAVQEKTKYETEYRIKDKNGNYHWFKVHGIPVFKQKGEINGWIGACFDITEQIQREELLENYAARLEQSNRDLQEFAYIASHDLQEPARKILAFGDRLQSKYKDVLDERALDYLERMMRASQRMQNLINSLLAFSRVETQIKPFVLIDLTETIKEVIEDLELMIERTQAKISFEQLPAVEADKNQMYQLFENLIKNAIKFQKAEPTPVIKIYQTDKSVRPEKVTIVVEDNGIGIDQQYEDRIFKPFQRLHTREEYEGSGMGLAICRRIIERHRGRIYFKSQPEKGTKFFVELPVKQKKQDKQ